VTRGNILITGASTGIGEASAVRLAQLGYKVFAGIRKTADGEALRARVTSNITPVLLDVTDANSIENAVSTLAGEPLAGLLNNAGVAVAGPLELVPIEQCRSLFEVNVIGLMAVTQACLPLLRSGRGRIVNMGSIAGRSPLPGSSAYDASKFAIEAITDSMRMELRSSGISVSLIEPGAVATPIWEKTVRAVDELSRQTVPEKRALYAGLISKIRDEAANPRYPVPPEKVADAVIHAMTARKPRTRYLVGLDNRIWLLLNLLPDRWRDRLILSNISQ
jgi:NAD(P)-dependent dehydrogenase (short-subunit alcohol dehydrogenase family)